MKEKITREEEKLAQSTTDVAASGTQNLLDTVIRRATEKATVIESLFRKDTSLVKSAGSAKTLRVETRANDAEDFNEGSDIAAHDTLSYSTIVVTPTYFGTSDTITGAAMTDADYDVTKRVKKALSDGMAARADVRARDVLFKTTRVTDEAVGDSVDAQVEYQLDNSLVVNMVSLTLAAAAKTLGTDYDVDFYRGYIKFAANPGVGSAIVATYDYTAHAAAQCAVITTVTDLVVGDLQDGITLFETNSNELPTTSLVHAFELNNLRKDELFIEHGKSGPELHTLKTNKLTYAVGLEFMQSMNTFEGIVGIVQRDEFGACVWKEQVTIEDEKIQKRAGDIRVKAWARSKCALQDVALTFFLFNAHKYAYTQGT